MPALVSNAKKEPARGRYRSISAYEDCDRREDGWIKTVLDVS